MSWLDAPLLRTLRTPAAAQHFGAAEWELAVQQARAAQLLGRFGAVVEQAGVAVPAAVARHFSAMRTVVGKQHDAVRWEVGRIAQALARTGAPVLLLKGAAYVMCGAPAALGRTFSDVDILVPKSILDSAENALQMHGWVTAAAGAYDQRYYRQWMHELPPMVHLHRETTLDVHHNILPETARIQTRPDLLLESRQAVPGHANVYVPAPADQILHSACHLFHEGQWRHGLRDLSDLDRLLRGYLDGRGTVEGLRERAQALNLEIPFTYALRCVHRVFQTPLPPGTIEGFRKGRWMEGVFVGAARSAHHSMAGASTRWMEAALYVRSHYLRMPLRLLLPHLLHQAVARESDKV